VESRAGQLLASGDLYAVDPTSIETAATIGSVPLSNPDIPRFPITDYTYYLRVTHIESTGTTLALTFEAFRFCPRRIRSLSGEILAQWVLESKFVANMTLGTAPAGYPTSSAFYSGSVVTNPDDPLQNTQVQMGWISPKLRKATIEIDRVPGASVPQSNDQGATWQSVFRSFGWDVTIIVSDDDVTKPGGTVWDARDAERAMQAHRDSDDLDAEWRYYILVAQEVNAPADAFGFMYHPKREAIFITSQFVFPEVDTKWGLLRGKRFDTTEAFFRTAVHEMGHAMGLGHNETGFHFMRPTPAIAQGATANTPFPTNISWSFDPEDEHRLRHWPDIQIRPGGNAGGGGGGLPLPEASPFKE
jgi:hypothetical protein